MHWSYVFLALTHQYNDVLPMAHKAIDWTNDEQILWCCQTEVF